MAVTYFNVTGNYSTFSPAGSDLILSGHVLFTPVFHAGDIARGVALTPPTGFVPVAVPGKIVNGVVKGMDGGTLQLQSATSDLNLAGSLYYAVTFTNMTATTVHPTMPGITTGSRPFEIGSFNFLAPTDASPINLIQVTPIPGVTNVQGALALVAANIADANAFSRGFLTTVTDQATAQAYFGVEQVWFDPKNAQFGANGNNTGNDAPAINAALAAANAAGGGIVFLPRGTYRITQPVGLASGSWSNVHLIGVGGASKIVAAANVTPLIGSWYRSSISDVSFDAGLQGSPSMNIHMSESVVERCIFDGWTGSSVRLNDGTYDSGLGLLNRFHKNNIMQNTGYGVYQTYRWSDSWITENNVGSTLANLSLEGGPVRVLGNHLNGTPQVNIELRGNKRVAILGNVLEGSRRESITYDMPSWLTTDAPQIHIGDNMFSNGGKESAGTYSAIRISGLASDKHTSGFSIVGNLFACEDAGSGWNYVVNASHADAVTATGNQWPLGFTVAPILSSDSSVTSVGNTSGNTDGAINRSESTLTITATLGATSLTDYVYWLAAGAHPTMPPVAGNTNRYTVVNTTGSAISLAAGSGQTIMGASTLNIVANASYDLLAFGTDWRIV